MSAAKVNLPIAPVRTGGAWVFDFLFYTDKALTQAEDWTGRQAVLAFVPRSAALRANAFKLTSAGGGLEMLANGAGIRLGKAGTEGLTPATYDWELSWLDGDDEPTRVLVGSVVIEQGLDEVADGEEVVGPISITGGAGQVVKAFAPAGVVQVVQGAGAQGPAGLSDAERAEILQASGAAADATAAANGAAASANTAAANADTVAGQVAEQTTDFLQQSQTAFDAAISESAAATGAAQAATQAVEDALAQYPTLGVTSVSIPAGSTAGTALGDLPDAWSYVLVDDAGGKVELDGDGKPVLAESVTYGVFTYVVDATPLTGGMVLRWAVQVTALVTLVDPVFDRSLNLFEGASQGTLIAILSNPIAGETLALTGLNASHFQWNGANLEVGATPSAAGDLAFTTRRTHPYASNSPHDTALTATVDLVVADAQWWQPGAFAQIDVANDRAMINGVEYASIAAAVTAGAATTVSGGGWTVVYSGPTITQVSVVVDGVASANATPATLEYLVSMDDGGASLTDDFIYIGRASTGNLQSGVTAASAAVATLALQTSAASTPVRAAAKYKLNNFTGSKNGGNGVSDTAGAMPATARFTIGNRYDGLRPWNGAVNSVTILIDREFTTTECEMMSGVGVLRGMVWGRWNTRLAFTQAGKTYLGGYNTRDNRMYAVVQDAVSRKTLDVRDVTDPNEIPVDDHSNVVTPGQLLPNGQFCVLYGGHDNDAFLRFRRSTNDMPGNLGEEIQIPLDYASTTSYAQLYLNGNELFAICQTRGNRYWYIFQSSDFGATWTKRKALFVGVDEGGGGPPQHYMIGSDVNDGVLTIYTFYHAVNLQNRIRKASLDFNTGVLSSAGVALGSIYDANPDVAIAEIVNLELVRLPASGHKQRLEGVRGNGLAIVLADTADAWATCTYMLGRYTGGAWVFTDVTAGSSFGAPANPSYIGGIAFAEHAHTGYLLYTASSASGNNLGVQHASADGVTFASTTIVNNAAVKTMRPICPKGATADLAVWFQRSPRYDDFNDMAVDAYSYPAAA